MPLRKKESAFSRVSSPALIIGSFVLVILAGTLLLMLPFATKSGQPRTLVDAFFTAVSATCVTGITVFDTFLHWSVFGQAVILLLIQTGGLGLITITLFFASLLRRKMGARDLSLAIDSTGYGKFSGISGILRAVVSISLLAEVLGAVIMMPRFVGIYGNYGIFMSIFTSVSAYCNAGFDLCGMEGAFSGMAAFASDPLIQITIMCLVIAGGLGVVVWFDLRDSYKKRRLSMHSSIVLKVSAALIVAGAATILLFEYKNPVTLGGMAAGDKVMNAFFVSVSSRTAGFATFDMVGLTDITRIVVVVLMFIGAAPGSAGGGIKVTTFWIIFATVRSFLKGDSCTVASGRRVRPEQVYRALTIMILMLLLVVVSCGVIYGIEKEAKGEVGLFDTMFITVSACSNTGYVALPATDYTVATKIILACDMFLGRVGLVTVALALTARRSKTDKMVVLPEGNVIIG